VIDIPQLLVGVIGVTVGFNKTHSIGLDAAGDPITRANNISAVNAQIAFICIFIFFFASTWGPGAWIVIGEVFPLPIRSRGVALSTASNWLWNTIIAVITPYMVNPQDGDMKSSVFFVWFGLVSRYRRTSPRGARSDRDTVSCRLRVLLLPGSRDQGMLYQKENLYLLQLDIRSRLSQGLTLEQVDKMLDESTPRTSSKWRPTNTFAHELGMTTDTGGNKLNASLVDDVQRSGSAY